MQNINKIRTEIHTKLIQINADIEGKMSWAIQDYGGDDFFQEHPEEFPLSIGRDEHIKKIDNLISSYYNEVLKSTKRGNILDAFSLILAIYETTTLELPSTSKYTPHAWDYNFERSVNQSILSYLNKFYTQLTQTTLSMEEKKVLIDTFIERYIFSKYKYKLDYFQPLAIIIIDNRDVANYLFEESIKNLNLK